MLLLILSILNVYSTVLTGFGARQVLNILKQLTTISCLFEKGQQEQRFSLQIGSNQIGARIRIRKLKHVPDSLRIVYMLTLSKKAWTAAAAEPESVCH